MSCESDLGVVMDINVFEDVKNSLGSYALASNLIISPISNSSSYKYI